MTEKKPEFDIAAGLQKVVGAFLTDLQIRDKRIAELEKLNAELLEKLKGKSNE